MATSYVRSVITNFGGDIVSDRFFDEIEADGGITKTLNDVEVTGDVVTIIFASALGAEETVLDAVIAAHSGALPNPTTATDSTGSTIGTTTTLAYTQTVDRVISFPDATTTLVGTDTIQTFTNKSFGDTLRTNAIDSVTGVPLVIGGATATALTLGASDITTTVLGTLTVTTIDSPSSDITINAEQNVNIMHEREANTGLFIKSNHANDSAGYGYGLTNIGTSSRVLPTFRMSARKDTTSSWNAFEATVNTDDDAGAVACLVFNASLADGLLASKSIITTRPLYSWRNDGTAKMELNAASVLEINAIDALTGTTMTIGGATATALTLGAADITTSILGTLNVSRIVSAGDLVIDPGDAGEAAVIINWVRGETANDPFRIISSEAGDVSGYGLTWSNTDSGTGYIAPRLQQFSKKGTSVGHCAWDSFCITTDDADATPVARFTAGIRDGAADGSPAALTTRALFGWYNNTVLEMQLTAAGVFEVDAISSITDNTNLSLSGKGTGIVRITDTLSVDKIISSGTLLLDPNDGGEGSVVIGYVRGESDNDPFSIRSLTAGDEAGFGMSFSNLTGGTGYIAPRLAIFANPGSSQGSCFFEGYTKASDDTGSTVPLVRFIAGLREGMNDLTSTALSTRSLFGWYNAGGIEMRLDVNGSLHVDTISSITTDTNLLLSANGTGIVRVDDELEVDSIVSASGSDLIVDPGGVGGEKAMIVRFRRGEAENNPFRIASSDAGDTAGFGVSWDNQTTGTSGIGLRQSFFNKRISGSNRGCFIDSFALAADDATTGAAMMTFNAARREGMSDLTGDAITTRDLFSWTNNGTEHMKMAVDGALQIDTINELTAAAGVTIETVLLKDGLVDGRDVAVDGAALDAISTPERALIVSPSGGQYATIAAALSAASGLSPTISAPVSILVYPGVYTESNPLTMIPYVDMIAQGGPHSVFVKPSIDTLPIVNVADESVLKGFHLTGATGIGGIGIRFAAGAGTHGHVRDCAISDCETGIQVTGSGTDAEIARVHIHQITGDAMEVAVSLVAGGVASLEHVEIAPTSGGSIGTGIAVDGAGTSCVIGSMTTVDCDNGAFITNGGHLETNSSHFHDCVNAIRIGSTDGTSLITGTNIHDSTTYDIFVEGSGSVIEGSGNIITSNMLNINPASVMNLSYASPTDGDRNFTITGELHVGSHDRPTESVFGEGDSTVLTMAAQWNTNLEVGTWTDKTTILASSTGSTTNLFPALTVNSTMYFGGDWEFPGIKVEATQAIVLGSGWLEWEFWNGSAWTVFKVMSALDGAPYTQFAHHTFETAEPCHTRFGTMTAWATKSLNSVTKYWVRVRVITASITTQAIVQRIKLHTNRTEISADGRIMTYGAARPPADFVLEHHGSSPADGTVQFSTNCSIEFVNNRFANNTIDTRGVVLPIPQGVDTSLDSTLTITWVTADAAANDVEIEVYYVGIESGDTIGSLPETYVSSIVTNAGANRLNICTFDIDLSELVPGDLVALRYFRDATGGNADDTLGSAIDLIKIQWIGSRWLA